MLCQTLKRCYYIQQAQVRKKLLFKKKKEMERKISLTLRPICTDEWAWGLICCHTCRSCRLSGKDFFPPLVRPCSAQDGKAPLEVWISPHCWHVEICLSCFTSRELGPNVTVWWSQESLLYPNHTSFVYFNSKLSSFSCCLTYALTK